MKPQPIHYDWDSDGAPRKPAVLCIGAQKAGTSWLAQMLGQHPQVWIPPFKETHFFNYQFIPGHRYWIEWHYRTQPTELRQRHIRRQSPIPPEVDAWLDAVSTSKRMFTNHWYKQIFAPAPAHALPADFTPEYSTLPDEGVAHVASFLPRAKAIYLIRDPADRAISQLRMNLMREKRRPVSVADWLREAENPVLAERGDYATYIPRWQRHFGDRLLILPYGRIARDPDALMQQVETHLGIGPFVYAGLRNKVFAAPEGEMVPPPEVRTALRTRFAAQYDYLTRAFPKDFVAQLG